MFDHVTGILIGVNKCTQLTQGCEIGLDVGSWHGVQNHTII